MILKVHRFLIVLISLVITVCGLLSTVSVECQASNFKFQNSNKIICFSPAITEIVFGLGAGENIIAVSDFCNYPPEAKHKLNIGGFINPSFEQILLLSILRL